MQDNVSQDALRSHDPHDDPHDDLRVEDLDGPHVAQPRSLALTRRLYMAWKGPRGPRGRAIAARALAGGLTVVLALMLVAMVGDTRSHFSNRVSFGADPVTVTASTAAPMVTLAGQPPSQVGTSDWRQMTLPNAPGTTVRSMAPSPTDPSTIFACTGTAITSPGDATPGPIQAWRTRDSGQHWSSLPLPPIQSAWCDVRLAADGSLRMTLVTGNSQYAPVSSATMAATRGCRSPLRPSTKPRPQHSAPSGRRRTMCTVGIAILRM